MIAILLTLILLSEGFDYKFNVTTTWEPLNLEARVIVRDPRAEFVTAFLSSDDMESYSEKAVFGRKWFLFKWRLEKGIYKITFYLLDKDRKVIDSLVAQTVTVLENCGGYRKC